MLDLDLDLDLALDLAQNMVPQIPESQILVILHKIQSNGRMNRLTLIFY